MRNANERQRRYFESGWIGLPAVVSGGFHWFNSAIDLKPHVHQGFELTYVSEGEVAWELEEGGELRLSGGCAALIQPGAKHFGKRQVINPSRLFWLVFDPEAPGAAEGSVFKAEELSKLSAKLRACGNAVWSASEELAQGFEAMLEALTRRESCETASLDARIAVCRLFGALLRADMKLREAEGDALEFVEEARKIMSESLASPPSMPEISERLGLSAAHFAERFKRESGMTPADYLRRLRCERAMEMLSKSEPSVTEIAFKLGFSTSQHFADVFKRYVGETPSAFRRRTSSSS